MPVLLIGGEVRLAKLARLAAELRRAPSDEDGARALAGLRVRRAEEPTDAERGLLPGANAIGRVERGGAGSPLDEAAGLDALALGPGVYPSIPGSAARVGLLARLRASAPALLVHAVVGDEGTHLARALIDAPRRALRALAVPAPEPGDRFGAGFAHRFFDEEALLAEIARAGLRVRARRGSWFALEAGPPPPEHPASFTVELARVSRAVRAAERARLADPPELAVAAMRARGAALPARGPLGRARLRRAIGWVDALAPGGPNCYRRTLLELALDAGAARETLVFGLDVGRTGHVAFDGREDRAFDVAFEIGPDPARDP